jgi:arylsulfatase A-like enzyme
MVSAASCLLATSAIVSTRILVHTRLLHATDLGSNDVGWSDPTVLSPTIDALGAGPNRSCQRLVYSCWSRSHTHAHRWPTDAARSGIRLPHTYAYHWCAPSRAAFFTGRYVPMHGYEDGGDGPATGTDGQGTGTASAVPLRFRLLPQVLQTAGCESIMMASVNLQLTGDVALFSNSASVQQWRC